MSTVPNQKSHSRLSAKEPDVLNGPLSGYNVSFKDDTTQFQATTTQLSYNYTGAVPGSVYEVSVYAFNEAKGVTKRGPAASLFTPGRMSHSAWRLLQQREFYWLRLELSRWPSLCSLSCFTRSALLHGNRVLRRMFGVNGSRGI
ncbi:hypothetical protein MTO96_018696 [Rhipicephalus appendiculatus]